MAKRKIAKSDRQKAMAKADKYCSLYVRLSNADEYGYCTCYTCRKRLHRKKIQCGHRIGRGYISVRYNLDNVRPQCRGCNSKRMGNGRPEEFKAHLIDEIGEERVKAVDDKVQAEVRDPANNGLDTANIVIIAEYFKNKIIEISKNLT